MRYRKKLGILAALLIIGTLVLAGCKENVGTPEDNAVTDDPEETAEEDEDQDDLVGKTESEIEEEEKEEATEEQEAEEKETDEESDTKTSAKSKKVGFCCIDMSNPYYETLEKSMENALEDKGYTLVVKDPASDARKQKEQIQEFIDMGVSCVFLSPVDWDSISESLKALKEAGIPVINIDTEVKSQDLVAAYIGSDNVAAGELCGEDLIGKFPKGGKVVILECLSMNSINSRLTGFEKTISGLGFDIIARQDVYGEKSLAKEAMETILADNPQIDAVMCGNDQIALGAMEACQEAGRSEMIIYGVDGSPEVKAAIAEDNSLITATVAQTPINMGTDAVKIAMKILSGEELEEKSIYEEVFLINKENVDLYGTSGWQ